MFPLFLKKTAEVLAPCLAVVFRRLIHLGSFPVCWRVNNVTLIPKGPPSSTASNYRPISLTPILSKVFEWLVSVRLRRFMKGRGVLPTTQFAYRKGLSTCDALLCVAQTLQCALEIWQEARIVQIDFSATFDRVKNQGILCKFCSVGVGGSVLSVLTQLLSIGHSMSWWMVVVVNWLTLCQGCLREVFWARSCSSCSLRSFSV